MNPQAAQITFAIIMAFVVFVWAISLRMASRLGMREQVAGDDPWGPISFEPSEPTKGSVAEDVQTVRGEIADVSVSIADQFQRTAVPGNFAVLYEIKERTDDRVSVKKTGPLICNQPSGMYFSEAEFELRQLGANVVEVRYRLGFDRFRTALRRICLGLVVGLALPVMVIVAFLIWILAVNNADPGIRWQVFQALQICHALWPPFLVMWLYRSGRVHSRTHVSNLLRSLSGGAPRRNSA